MNELEKKKLTEALSTISDPHTGQPLVSSDGFKGVQVEDSKINVILAFKNLSEDQKNKLNFSVLEALYGDFPKYEVHIHFELNEGKSSNPLPHVKNVIAVASGKGGVGKSTVSTNLALGLVESGYRVGLLDADLYGPSIPTMFGMQGKRPEIVKIHGKPKLRPLEKYGLHLISIGFVIEPEQAVILRGPRLAGILKQFISDCLWPELDFLIIDLPPGTGDIQLTMVQTLPVTGAVVVTTPQEVAVADAVKASHMFMMPNINVPILGVIENMSWFTPAELPDHKYYLFGKGGGSKLADITESELLGKLPLIQSVREAGDSGKPIILDNKNQAYPHFRKMTDKVLYYLELRNKTKGPTHKVEINR